MNSRAKQNEAQRKSDAKRRPLITKRRREARIQTRWLMSFDKILDQETEIYIPNLPA